MTLDVASILGDDGNIARRLKTYESRPQQLEMARSVEQAIRTQSHLIVEAGTGVGKSFAYLVPAILAMAEAQAKAAEESKAARRNHDDDDDDWEPDSVPFSAATAAKKKRRRVRFPIVVFVAFTASGLRFVVGFRLSFGDRQNRGDEVREALADASPCFDDQVCLCADRPLNRLSHFQLLRARFVGRKPSSDVSFVAENRTDIEAHGSLWKPTRQMSSLCGRPSTNASTSATTVLTRLSMFPDCLATRSINRLLP